MKKVIVRVLFDETLHIRVESINGREKEHSRRKVLFNTHPHWYLLLTVRTSKVLICAIVALIVYVFVSISDLKSLTILKRACPKAFDGR